MNGKPFLNHFRFLAAFGVFAMLLGLAVPIFMYLRFGFSYENVYDQSRHVIGHIQSFWFGVSFGILMFSLGAILFRFAKNYLDQNR